MDKKLIRVWLSCRKALGGAKIALLEDYFGSIEEIYEADADSLKNINEISMQARMSLLDKSMVEAEKIIDDCKNLGIEILIPEDDRFPKILQGISSPVQVLYAKGTIPDWNELLSVAVVGTRRYSEYGQIVAEKFSGELAEKGFTIISGMADGIDSFALKSALRVGGRTIAVMGCGLNIAYPEKNTELMAEIEKYGCTLSEYPPYSEPVAAHFPERNRIMSALSDGILAIEAPRKSGTLITANDGLEIGKPVFAVPNSIFAKRSEGTNELLKRGATAVTSAQDIIDAYPIQVSRLLPPQQKVSEENAVDTVEEVAQDSKLSSLEGDEKQIASMLVKKSMHIEEIAAKSGKTIVELNSILPMLEIEGIINKQAGNIYKYNI